MAITNTSSTGNATPVEPPTITMPQPTAPISNTTTSSTDGRWSFNAPIDDGAIRTGNGTEQQRKVQEKLTELFKNEVKNTGAGREYMILPIEKGFMGVYYGGLIVVMRAAGMANGGASFHTLIFASTNAKPLPVVMQHGTFSVEDYRVPGSAYDAEYVKAIHQIVTAGFPQTKLFDTGAMVLPEDFNPENATDMKRLASEISKALWCDLLLQTPGQGVVNLANMSQTNFRIALQFGNTTPRMNVVAEPVRSDVTINFSTVSSVRANNQSLNNTQGSRNIGTVSAFIDAVFAPQQQQQTWGQPMMQQPQGMFVPRAVITNVENDVGCTPEFVLFLLTAATTLSTNNLWARAFYQRFNREKKSGVDITDIGALAIFNTPGVLAGQFGKRVDDLAKATPNEYMMFIQQMFRSNSLFYALDIPLVGPESWYLDIFKRAAEGSVDASNTLTAAANQLTNGQFDHFYNQINPGAPAEGMFADTGTIVNLGWYTAADGTRRDIRDIDFVAVLNQFGEKDPKIVMDWVTSFYSSNANSLQQLQRRRQIISAVANTEVNFTGLAVRLSLTARFLNALTQACFSNKVTPAVTANLEELGMTTNYQMPNFISGGGMGGANAVYNSFSGIPVSGNNSITGNNSIHSRWQI